MRSIECLTLKCGGTPLGDANIYLYYSTIMFTCFYCLERPYVEVVATIVTFHPPSDLTISQSKRLPFDTALPKSRKLQ